jgi:hypothetical protein
MEHLNRAGFALVAAPAQYRVTGVKTLLVSQDGMSIGFMHASMCVTLFAEM